MKIRLNSVDHSVRATQAILQYGVGAMVDFPEQTLMTASPKNWAESVIKIHDERLEKMLGVDYFGMPGGKDEKINGISYCRFPEWYSCPKCKKLRPLNDWINKFKSCAPSKVVEKNPYMHKWLKCYPCKTDLLPARVVVACSHGHIDDFPWISWVHARSFGGAKQICNKPELEFSSRISPLEGLEGLIIQCKCGAKASLAGAFNSDVFEELDKKGGHSYNFKCTGRHPWNNLKESCTAYPKVLQRSSSSVYFPVTISSLVIPPYSSKLTGMIQNSASYIKFLDCLEVEEEPSEREQYIKKHLEKFIDKTASELGKTISSIRPIFEQLIKNKSETVGRQTKDTYRLEEYKVLSGSLKTDFQDDFVKEVVDIEEYNLPYLKGISLIHKVREVQALIGFTRLEPIGSEFIGDKSNSLVVNIKEKDMNWYPGYESRGEGIFIEFDRELIDDWVLNNPEILKRVESLNENYCKTYYATKRPRKITAKFLLLHTISHLLMKQLSFECGYSIASLKERIYCSDGVDGEAMSGLLIYTASGDSEGTMGGLVRQGRQDLFPAIFTKAVEAAKKCSNDPVCSLSHGQGRDSLNLAACYSCTLVPETSCEEYNIFLDRGMVIGTFDNPDIGFYSKNDYKKTFVKVKREKKKEKQSVVIKIEDNGTNLSNDSYADIWKELMDDAVDVDKPLIEELIANADRFQRLNRPFRASTFTVEGKKEEYEADLIWPEHNVMLFTSYNEDGYQIAVDSQWKCFYTGDSKLSWDMILLELE